MRSLALTVQSGETQHHPPGMPRCMPTAAAHVKLQALAALDDHANDLLHRVALHPRLARNGRDHARLYGAKEGAGARRARGHAFRAENLAQEVIRQTAAIDAVARELLAIVIRERAGVALDGLDAGAIAHGRASPADAGHELIDEAQFVECRPADVGAAPVRIRLQPHREGLREVFRRMRLRVPLAEVMHVAAAARPGAIPMGIRQRCRPEHVTPALATPQAIGIVERVPGLVTQDAHEPTGIAAFRLAHDAALQAFEPRVREIERHGDAGHAIGREPFFRKPHVRTELDAPILELRIQAAHAPRERRALERELEIAEAQLEEFLIREPRPRPTRPRAPRLFAECTQPLGTAGCARCARHRSGSSKPTALQRSGFCARENTERARRLSAESVVFYAAWLTRSCTYLLTSDPKGQRQTYALRETIACARRRSARLSIKSLPIRLLRQVPGIPPTP